MKRASHITSVSEVGGGRVAILLLLFALAIYQFVNAGFSAFSIVCLLPLLALAVIAIFHFQMLAFWTLVVVNYFVMWHGLPLPQGIPSSMYNEILEIVLLLLAVLNVKETNFDRCCNLMLLALIIWCSFCTLEVLNDTCDLGFNVGAWYTGARLLAFQLLYAFLVFSLYINTPKVLIQYFFLWGGLAAFAAFWVWKQKNIGFTDGENAWLQGAGRATHIIQGGTLTRYFSIYTDAANFGVGMASTGVAFIIFGITSKIKKLKVIFFVVGALCSWAMFPTGTRTAIVCYIAGFMAYIFLSKSIKIAVPFTIVFALAVFVLAFTKIGNGNQQIRRMRSAFDKNDASTETRAINQAAMKRYMREAPWGIGVGMMSKNVPANNKYKRMASIPTDSEYVFIWLRTGEIGITVFIITMLMMLGGACWIVFFKLKSPSLRGIGAGLCCAFISQQLGGYGNQVLMQFPNCLVFYGGLSIVYILPIMEEEWIAYENMKLAKQEELQRQKIERKNSSRV